MKLDRKDLYLVQTTALSLSEGKWGFAFFMEMGLGKTRTVIYEFDKYADDGMVDFLVIISPRTLRGTWDNEMEELGSPYPVHLFGKNKDAEKFIRETEGSCAVVMHYELALTRGGDFIEWLGTQGRLYIALDESTRIKNHKSKTGLRLKKITKQLDSAVQFTRVLSGAPAPQGPHDLWNQFDFIKAIKRPYYAFRNLYCRMGGWMGKQIIGSQNLDMLREETKENVFRARKSEWTDLPEKLPPVIYDIDMLPQQRQAYLEMMHEFVTMWGDEPITVQMAVTAKQKLAQIGTGFIYNDTGETKWLMPFEENPKLLFLDDYDEMLETKGIIFYHHKPALEALMWWANKHDNKWKVAVLKDKMKDDEIEYQKMLFNTDPSYKYIFCQSSSHKYGHTLLGLQNDGMPCHNSMFFENTYNRETRVQSEDRNHRHGQQFPVSYADIAISREDRLTIKALQKKEMFENALLAEFER